MLSTEERDCPSTRISPLSPSFTPAASRPMPLVLGWRPVANIALAVSIVRPSFKATL